MKFPVNGSSFRAVIIPTLLCLLASSVVRADALQDAKASFDAGKYPEALRLIGPAISKISTTDDSGQRYDLLMLRAECLLRINERASAITNFELASKAAPDKRSAAIARANSMLAKASPANKYTPKGQEAIDILDPESRKRAFDAYRTTLVAAAKPKYDLAMRESSLVPMMNVLPSLLDIANVELAATGAFAETTEDLKALGARARQLMNTETRRLTTQINSMELVANTSAGYVRRGLTSPERNTVSEVIDYAKKMEQTAREARRRAIELGSDGQAWEPVIADTADLADRAQALLDVAV